MRRYLVPVLAASALCAALLPRAAAAQDSGFNLDVHARDQATAKQIGLPVYPGAVPWTEKDSDSSAADLGFALNSFHFSLQAASFVTSDSPDQVLAFYRRPLSRYGEVLECLHGQPVGRLTATRSGLTCSDKHGGRVDVNGAGDSDHELRAGLPDHFRIVGVERTQDGRTKFGLVALVLPKDDDSK